MTSSDDPWLQFRRQMPVSQRWAYFDHAAVAPIPQAARDAVIRWADQSLTEGDTLWPDWNRRVESVRTLAARLLNADTAEVALVRNTTEGINLVANGFPWRTGDNVVTLDNEFPSNQYPWLALADRGVETRRVSTDDGRVDLSRLAAACDARTRIVSVSWVGYASGFRCDPAKLAELAHERGALLFLDAIQGLGVFPLDVRQTPVDFLAADGHKWLLGPEGAGIFYLRREHLDLLRPLGLGWHSVVGASDYSRIDLTLKPSAARYEGGTQNMAGFLGFAESLELLLAIGTEALSRRVLEFTDLACEKLMACGATVCSSRVGDERSGIVSFEVPGVAPLPLNEHLLKQGVVLRCRAGRLRISPHGYNNEADLERLVSGIESWR